MNYPYQPLLTLVARLTTIFVVTCFTLSATTGCGSDAEKDDEEASQKRAPTENRARHGNLTREGFTVTGVDLNQDEKPDQWTIKDSGGVERIERDMNFDGTVDMWQYPDDAGNVTEEEMDLDMDGTVDVVIYYKDGNISRKEMAVDFAGVFSIVKYYDKDGKLLRVERDEDADGTPDVFEYYQDDRRIRVGWDEDGDGKPDKFDQLQ